LLTNLTLKFEGNNGFRMCDSTTDSTMLDVSNSTIDIRVQVTINANGSCTGSLSSLPVPVPITPGAFPSSPRGSQIIQVTGPLFTPPGTLSDLKKQRSLQHFSISRNSNTFPINGTPSVINNSFIRLGGATFRVKIFRRGMTRGSLSKFSVCAFCMSVFENCVVPCNMRDDPRMINVQALSAMQRSFQRSSRATKNNAASVPHSFWGLLEHTWTHLILFYFHRPPGLFLKVWPSPEPDHVLEKVCWGVCRDGGRWWRQQSTEVLSHRIKVNGVSRPRCFCLMLIYFAPPLPPLYKKRFSPRDFTFDNSPSSGVHSKFTDAIDNPVRITNFQPFKDSYHSKGLSFSILRLEGHARLHSLLISNSMYRYSKQLNE